MEGMRKEECGLHPATNQRCLQSLARAALKGTRVFAPPRPCFGEPGYSRRRLSACRSSRATLSDTG